jgi:hypothetical protein
MQFSKCNYHFIVYYYFLIYHGQTAADVTITWMKNRSFFWNYKINIPQFHRKQLPNYDASEKNLFNRISKPCLFWRRIMITNVCTWINHSINLDLALKDPKKLIHPARHNPGIVTGFSAGRIWRWIWMSLLFSYNIDNTHKDLKSSKTVIRLPFLAGLNRFYIENLGPKFLKFFLQTWALILIPLIRKISGNGGRMLPCKYLMLFLTPSKIKSNYWRKSRRKAVTVPFCIHASVRALLKPNLQQSLKWIYYYITTSAETEKNQETNQQRSSASRQLFEEQSYHFAVKLNSIMQRLRRRMGFGRSPGN